MMWIVNFCHPYERPRNVCVLFESSEHVLHRTTMFKSYCIITACNFLILYATLWGNFLSCYWNYFDLDIEYTKTPPEEGHWSRNVVVQGLFD